MLSELQKRADRADQSVLIFPGWCKFLGNACAKLFHYVQCSYHLYHSTLYHWQYVSYTGAYNTLLIAPVLHAPVLEAPVIVALVLTALVLPAMMLATLVLFSGSTGATSTVLEAQVIVASVLSAPVLPAPVLLALLEINTVHKNA